MYLNFCIDDVKDADTKLNFNIRCINTTNNNKTRKGKIYMKILIIGTVGTGKTTLAKRLSKQYNIEYYEIDSILHDDNNGGIKRTFKQQDEIIKEINKNNKWIIEGVLRENLFYLLDLSDKIILLDVNRRKRNIRILIRYIKQKLKLEQVNYTPSLKMLKSMYKWSEKYDKNKKELMEMLDKYKDKVKIIK